MTEKQLMHKTKCAHVIKKSKCAAYYEVKPGRSSISTSQTNCSTMMCCAGLLLSALFLVLLSLDGFLCTGVYAAANLAAGSAFQIR